MCCALPCPALLCCAVLRCVVLCSVALCCAVLCYAIVCYATFELVRILGKNKGCASEKVCRRHAVRMYSNIYI